MSINDTHNAIMRLAGFAGWNSDTLLLLIARWAEENGAARPLLEHLSALASAEDEQPLDDDIDGGADPSIPTTDTTPIAPDANGSGGLPFERRSMDELIRHFEVLLGLVKILVADAEASRPSALEWRDKAIWAIDRAEAMLASPNGPVDQTRGPT